MLLLLLLLLLGCCCCFFVVFFCWFFCFFFVVFLGDGKRVGVLVETFFWGWGGGGVALRRKTNVFNSHTILWPTGY